MKSFRNITRYPVFFLCFIGAFVISACCSSPNDTITNSTNPSDTALMNKQLLFVGSYSPAFYVYSFDTLTGELRQITKSSLITNPSYLVVHSNRKWIYAVSETNDGAVNAYNFDADKDSLVYLNSVKVKGDAPCYISIDKSGRYVLVANYTSGNCTVLKINNDGSLSDQVFIDQHVGKSVVTGRQDSPHAHQILQAANGFVYNTDLGVDKVFIYSLDTTNGHLINSGNEINTAKGAGPRHLVFHPNLKWVYVLGELNGTIEAYVVDNQKGSCQLFQTVSSLETGASLPAGSADIHISPDGRFLYASNRAAHNNIGMYAIDQTNGHLQLIGHQSTLGSTPRNFTIDPTGKFLLVANQDSNNIVVFRLDNKTGKLVETDVQEKLGSPVCLVFY